eukprot:13588983-Alexandrium_andersonii.AAC.1
MLPQPRPSSSAAGQLQGPVAAHGAEGTPAWWRASSGGGAALPTPSARAAAAASARPLHRGPPRSSGAGARTRGAAAS